MAEIYQPQSGDWKYGLFSCCSSCSDSLCAICCPNCFTYITARDMGESCCTSWLNCLFFPLCLCCLRGSARNHKGIDGGILGDFLVTQCCPCCAIIQMKREYD